MRVILALSLLAAGAVSSPLIHGGPEGRIFWGSIATPHQFPYQAALILHMDKWTSRCGGSLISPEWVLTAAHCLKGMNSVTVMLGAHNIEQHEDGRYEADVLPEKFIIHEGWDSQTIENDIALVKLPKPATLSKNIQTIALPKRDNDLCAKGCSNATTSGWGFTEKGETDVLKYLNMPIIPNAECKKTILGILVKDTNICAYGKSSEAVCHGDSGGPLVAYENGAPILVGITSFGGETCEDRLPSVYTRVHSYIDWIASQTGLKLN